MTPKLLRGNIGGNSGTANLRRGNPGNRGGGRKPWTFRDEMHRALVEGQAGAVVQRIISGDLLEVLGHRDDGTPIIGETKNADRLKAIQIAASYDVGLPVQPTVDLTPREPAHLTSVQLAEALPRLVGLLPGTVQGKAALLAALETDDDVVS